ncbi:MAG: VOC family protein, partial [Anaerolineae bacterium]|nr:VOC family protein [Anaerolineae bacterium]
NGVELYCDRPEDEWPRANAQIEMTTGRLDIDNLLATIQSADETKDRSNGGGTDLGHIHLQGSDLAKARHFYHETLGMDVMQENYPGALFMAAGGYHHHLGVNTWNSAGGAPAAADTVGLASFALQIPDEGNWYVLQERLNERGHKPIKARDYGYATGVQYSDPDENLVELFIDKAALSGKTGTNLEVEIVL